MKREIPMKRAFIFEAQGFALMLSIIVLLALSGVIIGISRNIGYDLGISRNLRLRELAFNWADSANRMAEDMIDYAIFTRGDEAGVTFSKAMTGGKTYSISVGPDRLFDSKNGTITLISGGTTLSTAVISFVGRGKIDGGSILAGEGYSGFGFSGAASKDVPVYYSIQSNSAGIGMQSYAAEMYRKFLE